MVKWEWEGKGNKMLLIGGCVKEAAIIMESIQKCSWDFRYSMKI